jgi:hypothetical protein
LDPGAGEDRVVELLLLGGKLPGHGKDITRSWGWV